MLCQKYKLNLMDDVTMQLKAEVNTPLCRYFPLKLSGITEVL